MIIFHIDVNSAYLSWTAVELSLIHILPLGYVKDTPSGTFKNIMVERIDSIETTLAHIVPEGVSFT